jgi:hypothetical protein
VQVPPLQKALESQPALVVHDVPQAPFTHAYGAQLAPGGSCVQVPAPSQCSCTGASLTHVSPHEVPAA